MDKGALHYMEWDDGHVEFGYEDPDVEIFGGGSYEVIYKLDKENIEKMAGILSEKHTVNLQEMIIAEFGKYLDRGSLYNWMREKGIQFDFWSWVS